MKKIVISKLFLYRHRLGIGYTFLGIAFALLLFLLPLISPSGLSVAEMESTVTSNLVNLDSVADGNIVDLPYHALQKLSIKYLGLTSYTVKLPSIILGLLLGFLFILLLNRWFKNNVAIIASLLSVLSAPFLYLAGNGTPLIMVVFWPTLLLWLGSKIQGVKRPRTSFCILFAFALFPSIFTPYMIYLDAFILLYALSNPHLRFTIKNLPKAPFLISFLIVFAGIVSVGVDLIEHPFNAVALLFTEDFTVANFFSNLKDAFLPFFSWTGNVTSTMLNPMLGLASLALVITGLISTTKGFLASRNAIASLLILFTVIISGFNTDSAILIILPFAILTAHGIRYILEQWYGLFPENPYARIFAIFPIGLFLSIMIVSSTLHFVFGYRYNPAVANEFNDDLSLIYQQLEPEATILIPAGTLEYDFYKILEQSTDLRIVSSLADASKPLATLGQTAIGSPYTLERIITSSKSTNSDRIYIYR